MKKNSHPDFSEVKYETIKNQILRRYISPAKDGDPLPSVALLKKEFNVSYSTISRVMLELDRDNLLQHRRGKGVYITKSGYNKVFLLSMCIPDTDSDDPYLWTILRGALNESIRRGVYLTTMGMYNILDQNMRNFLLKSVSGIMLLPNNPKLSDRLTDLLEKNNKKYIFLDRFFGKISAPCVVNDFYSATKTLGEKLIAAGFQKIYVVFTDSLMLKMPPILEKIAGIEDICRKHKIFFRKIALYDFFPLLKKTKLEKAFILTIDDIVMEKITSRFPEESRRGLPICGFGNIQRHPHPTIDQNLYQLGRKSMEIITRMTLEDYTPPDVTKIPCTIIPRYAKYLM